MFNFAFGCLLLVSLSLPACADKRADRILRKALHNAYSHHCLVADIEVVDGYKGDGDTMTGRVYLMKPNLMLIRFTKKYTTVMSFIPMKQNVFH